ncbi:MAG: hypothetical protein V4511_04275 [Bacteroidota bacterium]
MPFSKLPYELRIESTQKTHIVRQGAKRIITGRLKNKKKAFFTGLIPAIAIGESYYCLGNDYEFVQGEKKNSLIIFKFSENSECLTLYYFNLFYKNNWAARKKFVEAFILSITPTEILIEEYKTMQSIALLKKRGFTVTRPE